MTMHSERLAAAIWFRDRWAEEKRTALVSWGNEYIAYLRRIEREWRQRIGL